MGDGFIDLRHLRLAVDEAGYAGPIEVEIFNQALWERPMDEVSKLMRDEDRTGGREPNRPIQHSCLR